MARITKGVLPLNSSPLGQYRGPYGGAPTPTPAPAVPFAQFLIEDFARIVAHLSNLPLSNLPKISPLPPLPPTQGPRP